MKFNNVHKYFVLLIIFCFSLAALSLTAYEDFRVETWTKNLSNEKALIRKSSAKYLGLIGDRRAIPYLLKALKDEEPQVRAEACNALGLLGDESVKEYLENVLYKDTSPMVRSSAKRGLDNIETYTNLQKEKKLKEMKEKLKTTPPQAATPNPSANP